MATIILGAQWGKFTEVERRRREELLMFVFMLFCLLSC
jgi:hypothetical protein